MGRTWVESQQLERKGNPVWPSVWEGGLAEAWRGIYVGQSSRASYALQICAPQIFSIEYLKINLFAISYALLKLWTWLSNYHEYNLLITHVHDVSFKCLSLYRALVSISAETFDWICYLNFAFQSFSQCFFFLQSLFHNWFLEGKIFCFSILEDSLLWPQL